MQWWSSADSNTLAYNRNLYILAKFSSDYSVGKKIRGPTFKLIILLYSYTSLSDVSDYIDFVLSSSLAQESYAVSNRAFLVPYASFHSTITKFGVDWNVNKPASSSLW